MAGSGNADGTRSLQRNPSSDSLSISHVETNVVSDARAAASETRAATVEEANSHRSYGVGAVRPADLVEQQKIADAFFGEGLIPKKLDTTAVKIWTPHAP